MKRRPSTSPPPTSPPNSRYPSDNINPAKRTSKMAAQNQPTLSATYTSTTNAPFAISLPLAAAPDSTSVEHKSKYLSELRQSVISAQGQINRELTARMEEDKAREAGAGTANGAKVVDDEKEEENYGEEVVEEEED